MLTDCVLLHLLVLTSLVCNESFSKGSPTATEAILQLSEDSAKLTTLHAQGWLSFAEFPVLVYQPIQSSSILSFAGNSTFPASLC